MPIGGVVLVVRDGWLLSVCFGEGLVTVAAIVAPSRKRSRSRSIGAWSRRTTSPPYPSEWR